MSTAISLPRVRGPGLGWLPEVLRQRITWLTVWRFLWAGPLIGCLPYAWLPISIPFAYVIGAVPAAVAGLLFATWYHGQRGRIPTWPWRAAVGAMSGAGSATLVALGMLLAWHEVNWFYVGVVAAHGVPTALVLGLTQKPAQRPAPARRSRTCRASWTASAGTP
jgi:hypothetical protein